MYYLSPCIVALPNKRVQSDAAAAAWYRGENWLCNALRIEADFGKVAARLTRRALSELIEQRRPLGATRPSRPPNCSMKPTPGLRPGFATLAPLRRIRAFGAMHLGGQLISRPVGSKRT